MAIGLPNSQPPSSAPIPMPQIGPTAVWQNGRILMAPEEQGVVAPVYNTAVPPSAVTSVVADRYTGPKYTPPQQQLPPQGVPSNVPPAAPRTRIPPMPVATNSNTDNSKPPPATPPRTGEDSDGTALMWGAGIGAALYGGNKLARAIGANRTAARNAGTGVNAPTFGAPQPHNYPPSPANFPPSPHNMPPTPPRRPAIYPRQPANYPPSPARFPLAPTPGNYPLTPAYIGQRSEQWRNPTTPPNGPPNPEWSEAARRGDEYNSAVDFQQTMDRYERFQQELEEPSTPETLPRKTLAQQYALNNMPPSDAADVARWQGAQPRSTDYSNEVNYRDNLDRLTAWEQEQARMAAEPKPPRMQEVANMPPTHVATEAPYAPSRRSNAEYQNVVGDVKNTAVYEENRRRQMAYEAARNAEDPKAGVRRTVGATRDAADSGVRATLDRRVEPPRKVYKAPKTKKATATAAQAATALAKRFRK